MILPLTAYVLGARLVVVSPSLQLAWIKCCVISSHICPFSLLVSAAIGFLFHLILVSTSMVLLACRSLVISDI